MAEKVCTAPGQAAVCKISANTLLSLVLDVCRSQAGLFIKSVRSINTLKLTQSDLTGKIGSHTRSSEPYFYDTAYTHNKHMGVLPVDTNGCCVMAKEIKTKAPDSNLVIDRPYARSVQTS